MSGALIVAGGLRRLCVWEGAAAGNGAGLALGGVGGVPGRREVRREAAVAAVQDCVSGDGHACGAGAAAAPDLMSCSRRSHVMEPQTHGERDVVTRI